MEFDVYPDDTCSCMVPWITLHNFIILPSANRSAKALRRRTIIKDLAEFKQQYERGRGELYWRSHIDKCPILDRVVYLKNLQTPKEKPKFEGVIGANMVSLKKRQIKKCEKKNSSDKFSCKLKNSKAVIRAAFQNFLKKRVPGEKTNLKNFKEAYNLPFDVAVIDEVINEILRDDSFAEYFSLHKKKSHTQYERENASARPTKKRKKRLEENPSEYSTVDSLLSSSLNLGTTHINDRDGVDERARAVLSLEEKKECFLPYSSSPISPVCEEETPVETVPTPDDKEPLPVEPVENSNLADETEEAVCVHTENTERVPLDDREDVEEPGPADFLLPVELVDTPPQSVCLESLPLVENVKESVLESPACEDAIVEEEDSVCLSESDQLNEMTVLEKRACVCALSEIQSANMKNLATDVSDDVILPPTPPETYDFFSPESKEPIMENLDDSGIVISGENRCGANNFPFENEPFGTSDIDMDIINSILSGVESGETHPKPIESFGNSHVNSNYFFSEFGSKPNRIIFSPSTDIFHIMGRTVAETMYEPDIQPNQNALPLDWENYFN